MLLWTPQSMQFISDGKFLAVKVKQRQNSLRIMVFVSQLGLTVIGKTQSFKASLIYYVPPHYFIVCLLVKDCNLLCMVSGRKITSGQGKKRHFKACINTYIENIWSWQIVPHFLTSSGFNIWNPIMGRSTSNISYSLPRIEQKLFCFYNLCSN